MLCFPALSSVKSVMSESLAVTGDARKRLNKGTNCLRVIHSGFFFSGFTPLPSRANHSAVGLTLVGSTNLMLFHVILYNLSNKPYFFFIHILVPSSREMVAASVQPGSTSISIVQKKKKLGLVLIHKHISKLESHNLLIL